MCPWPNNPGSTGFKNVQVVFSLKTAIGSGIMKGAVCQTSKQWDSELHKPEECSITVIILPQINHHLPNKQFSHFKYHSATFNQVVNEMSSDECVKRVFITKADHIQAEPHSAGCTLCLCGKQYILLKPYLRCGSVARAGEAIVIPVKVNQQM